MLMIRHLPAYNFLKFTGITVSQYKNTINSSLNCSSVRKASACNAEDPGSMPGSGRSPGEGNGNPLQYSCLENPMNRGALQATWGSLAGYMGEPCSTRGSKSHTGLSDPTTIQSLRAYSSLQDFMVL